MHTPTPPALQRPGPQRYLLVWDDTMPPLAWDPGRPTSRRPCEKWEEAEAIDQIGHVIPAIVPGDRCATVRLTADGYRARLLVTELRGV